MLIIRLVIYHTDASQIAFLPIYGLLWWTFADILPKGLPTLCFYFCFGLSPARVKVIQFSVGDNSELDYGDDDRPFIILDANDEEHESIVYSNSSGSSDFNTDSCRIVATPHGEQGIHNNILRWFWKPFKWMLGGNESDYSHPLLIDTNCDDDDKNYDRQSTSSTDPRLSAMSNETVSVLTSFASTRDLLVSRLTDTSFSRSSNNLTPSMLADNNRASIHTSMRNSTTNYPAYLANEHYPPMESSQKRSSTNNRGSVLYNTLVWSTEPADDNALQHHNSDVESSKQSNSSPPAEERDTYT